MYVSNHMIKLDSDERWIYDEQKKEGKRQTEYFQMFVKRIDNFACGPGESGMGIAP